MGQKQAAVTDTKSRNIQMFGRSVLTPAPGAMSKSEGRRPKSERNPKPEHRSNYQSGQGAGQQKAAFSVFGLRPSFGLRYSAFGFHALSGCSPMMLRNIFSRLAWCLAT